MKKISLLLLILPQILSAQADLEKIDQYLSKARADWDIPGISVAIVKDGKTVLSKGYGIKESGHQNLVDENTLFAIASNTKAFLSAALSILVDEGEISWDDKVRKYIPEFTLYDSYVSNEATIRDLLSHRVGLGTFSGDYIWYKSNLEVNDLILKLKYLPQDYPFRSGYGYSNLMYITAGEIINRVTGKNWDEFVNEAIFQPLDMKNTVTSTDELSKSDNVASPHKPFENGNQVLPWVNWNNMGAAGGIISNASDMSKWMIIQLNNGIWNFDTIISPKQQNIMWTPHNNFTLSEKSKESIPGRHFAGYGLGWSVGDYHGNMIVSHTGGYDGMYSHVLLVPDLNLGITILTNSMKSISTPLCYYIINEYINKDNRDWSKEWLERNQAADSEPGKIEQIKTTQVKKTKPTLALEKFEGTYSSGFHGEVIIKKIDKTFRLEFKNAPALSATLQHWHYDTWQIIWDETHAWFDFGTVQFQLDNKLDVVGLKFDVPNYDIFFDEMDLKKND
jgi:CubicO group peptidase (beta-lactamase class C family)